MPALAALENARVPRQSIVSRGLTTILREQADAAIKASRQDAVDREVDR